MPVPTMQSAFTGGELAPGVHSRVDIEKYGVGAATLLNFFVHAQGGISNRPGLEFVTEVKDSSAKTRVIPFIFSTTDTYALEFGDLYMRVIRNGAQVLEGAVTIISATQANPVVLGATGHGYANGDEVFISGVVGMTEINDRKFIVANKNPNDFELAGENGAAYSAYVSDGTVSRIFTLTTPYLTAELFELKFTQSGDIMTICHPEHEESDLARTGHAAWTLTPVSPAADIAAPTGPGVVYNGAGTGTIYDYVITAIDAETGEESIASAAANVASGDLTTAGDSADVTWSAVTGATSYNIYRADDGSGFYGFIGSAINLLFTDRNIEPEFADSPSLANTDPFSGSDNFPATVAYHQGRRWFGQTNNKPRTAWASQSANFSSHNVSDAVRDDDAITATIAGKQVNEIRHMVSITDLIIFTPGEEWLVSSSNPNKPVTPSTISFTPQSYFGSSEVQPLTIGTSILFVEDQSNAVRDLNYSLEIDGYKGNELSVLASHMFQSFEITDWAYAKAPYTIVWAVRDDGKVPAMTYNKEHQIWAWHLHETAGDFESVCSVPEGTEYAVYFAVKRKIGGVTKRFIERMHTRLVDDVRDYFFVDSGKSYDPAQTITGATAANPVVITIAGHGYSDADVIDITDVLGMTELNGNRYQANNVTTNTFELQSNEDTPVDVDGNAFTAHESAGVARLATSTVVGLDHLEGETVSIFADGNVLPQQVVASGALDFGSEKYSRVHAGLPYNADFGTLDVNIQDRRGFSHGKSVQVQRVIFKFEDSRGGEVGPNFDKLRILKQRERERYGDPIALFTGDTGAPIDSAWEGNGRIVYRQSDPVPVTILSIVGEAEIEG